MGPEGEKYSLPGDRVPQRQWQVLLLPGLSSSPSQHSATRDIFSCPPTKYFHSSQRCLLCLLVLQGLWAPSPNWLHEVSRNRGSYAANTNVLASEIKTTSPRCFLAHVDQLLNSDLTACPATPPAPRNCSGARIKHLHLAHPSFPFSRQRDASFCPS